MTLVNETSKETEVSVYVFESECYLAVNKIVIIIYLLLNLSRLITYTNCCCCWQLHQCIVSIPSGYQPGIQVMSFPLDGGID